MPIDFRSDTVTCPTPAMREAIADALVGDDVFDEDPTMQALQRRTASLLGKDDAIFVPSGTMSNQVAVRLHCRPGDEFLCEAGSHILNYEQSAHVQLSGVTARPVTGDFGVLKVEDLQDQIRPANEHFVRTRMVTLENTHNRGAGRIQPIESVQAICRWAHANRLTTHLDGARLFNAVVATGIKAAEWASHFDTVSVCFSKGLGAPVGSALAGPGDWIREARRHRKVLGGGMRQAGIIAAGALYALEHHVDRLADDHKNASDLADAIRALDGLTLTPPDPQTNMVIFEVAPELGAAAQFTERLARRGLLMLPISATRVRAVTHLDLSAAQVRQASEILQEVVRAQFASKA